MANSRNRMTPAERLERLRDRQDRVLAEIERLEERVSQTLDAALLAAGASRDTGDAGRST